MGEQKGEPKIYSNWRVCKLQSVVKFTKTRRESTEYVQIDGMVACKRLTNTTRVLAEGRIGTDVQQVVPSPLSQVSTLIDA